MKSFTMAFKCLLIFLFFVNVVQPLSLRKPESFVDSTSNNQGHSVLKLSEDVQILGEDSADAVQKIVQRVERKLHNSRHRGALSRTSPVKSLPIKTETKYEDSVATETKSTSQETGRHIQQWQVAVVVPPGLQQPGGLPPAMQDQGPQGAQSPPGSIWIQIPGYYSHDGHNTPIYYPGMQPTPVEQSPPMPVEEIPQTNNNEQSSNEQEHIPDENTNNIQPMTIDENNFVPEEETHDSSEGILVPDNESYPPSETNNENPEIPIEDNSENLMSESNDQHQPEMESDNSENPSFMNSNEPHREGTPDEESNQNEVQPSEIPEGNNENQYPYPTPAEDQNTSSQDHEETPVATAGSWSEDSNGMSEEEPVMPTKMDLTPEEQESAGQVNGGEQWIPGEEQPENSGQTDIGQNEITGGNIGAEERPSSSVPSVDTTYYCSRGQYPSENSCSKFINCWDGKAYEQECPAGLLFSTEGFCDFKENVNCGYRPNEGPKNITDCSIPYGTYRNPKNCSEFFVCVYRNPIKFACPKGLQYNNEIGVCDYPYKVHCYDASSQYPNAVISPVSPVPEEEKFPENEQVGGSWNGIDESGSSQAGEQPTAQYDLRRVPAGLVDTGLKCKSGLVIPLGKGCGRVSVCAPGGYSQLITCPQHTAYDSQVKRCISVVKARC